jgi:hypothetical protein
MKFIVTASNKRMDYTIDPESTKMTIKELKGKLEEKMGEDGKIEWENMMFISRGALLADEKTLEELNLSTSAEVFVVRKSKPPASVKKEEPAKPSTLREAPMTTFNPQEQAAATQQQGDVGNNFMQSMMSQHLDSILENPSTFDLYFQPVLKNMSEKDREDWKMSFIEQMKELRKNPEIMQSALNQVGNMSPATLRKMMELGAGGSMGPSPAMPQAQPGIGRPMMYPGPWQMPYVPPMGPVPSLKIPCFHGFVPPSSPMAAPHVSSPAFSQQSSVDYESLYGEQLKKLQDMGYHDKERNIEALRLSNGDVNGAANFLIEWNELDK